MASEPIPEPLVHQGVQDEKQPQSRAPVANVRGDLTADAGSDPRLELVSRNGTTQLNRVAEAVGGTLGEAVKRTRKFSGLTEQTIAGWKETVKDQAAGLRQDAEQALDAVQQSASVGFQQVREQVSETVESARLNASGRFREARIRARQLAHDYPLQLIAASAALGIVAGILLRVWRSNRYE